MMLRHFLRIFVWALTVYLGLQASSAPGQEDADPKKKKKPPFLTIDSVRVGYRPYVDSERFFRYKAGLWTPVYVQVSAGEDGVKAGAMTLETPDSEDVKTLYTTPFSLQPGERQVLMSYARPGNTGAEIKVDINADGHRYGRTSGANALPVRSLLILTLGSKMQDLQETLARMSKDPNVKREDFFQDTTAPRFAGFEIDAQQLPTSWVGYQGIDLVILSVEKEKFVEDLLAGDLSRLGALVQWVRRGGRLVVPLSWKSQPLAARLLQSPVWQPAMPAKIPENAGPLGKNTVELLEADILYWGQSGLNEGNKIGAMTSGNKKDKNIHLALLRDPKSATPADWEVLATLRGRDSAPLIVREVYGLGSITFLAFPLDQPPLTNWSGRFGFWARLLAESLYKLNEAPGQNFQNKFGGDDDGNQFDVSSQLYTALDNFDIRVIPFGWVALFILLYIVLVGPIDFLILRYVFGRLEWTWFTFPVIVAAVSVAAYYTAHAIKGEELKINQVDIVDFDLRTSPPIQGQPKTSHVYGTTFFNILSPRIQNYTLAVEPNAAFWNQDKAKVFSADMISWLGRPERDLNRRGSQSFFRKPYSYENVGEDGANLQGVPMGVWMTKSFTASWEAVAPTPPFAADLTYFTDKVDDRRRLQGTLKNELPDDLEDVWVFYRDYFVQIPFGLPGKSNGSKEVAVSIDRSHLQNHSNWINAVHPNRPDRIQTGKGHYDPTPFVKRLMVHQKLGDQNQSNYLFRGLDMSWRLKEDKEVLDLRPREAIVFARIKFRSGPADALSRDADHPLPTLLWMGERPGSEKPRPILPGTLNQDTYLRFIVPVRSSLQ